MAAEAVRFARRGFVSKPDLNLQPNRSQSEFHAMGSDIHSILVVDDDPNILKLAELSLNRLGYAVAVASSGKAAIGFLCRETVDLVITDIVMPDMDGFELLGALGERFPRLPVIAMSGGGQLSAGTYLKMAPGFHAAGTLYKPFNAEGLSKAIKAVETRSATLEETGGAQEA
jgi:DNA-binding NtrC family response regulator